MSQTYFNTNIDSGIEWPEINKTFIKPDKKYLTNKSFLSGLIPKSWIECVYDYDDRFFISLKLISLIPRHERLYYMQIFRKEFGNNLISNITLNKLGKSIFLIELKKENYKSN